MFESGAAVTVILGLWIIGITRVQTTLALYGAQSAALGLMTVHLGVLRAEPLLVIVGVAVVAVKGLFAPVYLLIAAKSLGCRRDDGVSISPPIQFFGALTGLALILLLHPLRAALPESALPSVGLLLLGMMVMITRRLALSQIVGFLMLENGIFLYTIGQPHTMPMVVEIGVLMDVLAGVMLAGLLAFKINKTFEHIDVTELKELRG
ncbi:MAG: hypothetical protein P4L33_18180 [Capsulimonadaceae bacterium]|nr:hypothetical protein [Capsulimonadaceae bacterium]